MRAKMSYLLVLSILVAFLTVVTLTKSQNINHKTHDVPAPPNGLISYPPPPTSDLQKQVGPKYVHRLRRRQPPPIHTPRTPHFFSHRRHRSRPPPMM
jgi:hypothetical protein